MNNKDEASTTSMPARDGHLESLWQSFKYDSKEPSPGAVDNIYDAMVVGAGITGLTAALLIQRAGMRCMVVEAHSVGYGTTGGTSAHINTFADTTYTETETNFGDTEAQLFADAVNEGYRIIGDNVASYGIPCDFEIKTGYIYAEDDQQVKALDEMYAGMVKVGLPINYTTDVPTPLSYQKAVTIPNQAQFHPLKYLQGLRDQYLKAGGVLLENSKVTGSEREDGVLHVKVNDSIIKTRNVLYATHIPPGITNLNFRCSPYRSYVLAVILQNETEYPDALVYDMQDPYHYTRTHVIDGQKYLVVGGNDHKTGHDDPEKAFADLEKYAADNYKVASVAYRWSSQYYVPADGLPYIGQLPGSPDGVFCATGYNGNGMMLGSIAGKILSDLAIGNQSRYEKLFSPARIKPIAGFTEFVKENADVAYHFVADRIHIHELDSLRSLKNDTGEVVEVNGKKIAAYRDSSGTVHALSPVCTHAKCIVNWNQEEKSWDCPCHGARYDIEGNVITGPASIGLQKLGLQ